MTGTEMKGGTWPLSDLAEVKMRGGDIPEPGSKEEELILAAWHVHQYLLGKVRREGRKAVRFGHDGFEWEGEIPQVIRVLWPAGTSPLPLSETDHDEGRRTLVTFLCTTRNLANIVRGRPDTRVRNGGTVPAAASRWWINSEFQGMPEGMKLPDAAADAAPDLIITEPDSAPAPAPAPVAAPAARDWWCPFIVQHCKTDIPMTRQRLNSHLQLVHKITRNSGLYDIVMEDAERLRGDKLDADAPEADEQVLLPGIQADVHEPEPLVASASVQRVPEIPARIAVPMRTAGDSVQENQDVISGTTLGSVAAQARVFAVQIAEMEEENFRLRTENAELREKLRIAEAAAAPGVREVRIDDSGARMIALHVASMVGSVNGSVSSSSAS
jgi:hypothetical protein